MPLWRKCRNAASVRWLVVGSLIAAAGISSAAAGSSGPIPGRSTVACDQSVGTAAEPYREAGVVLDRIGLPRGRYPWPLVRTRDPVFPFWAKWGALVRAGTGESVTISVARPWRRHAVIGWGDGEALSVEFLPCQSPAAWLAYAGGFSLKKRGCVPFEVQVGDRLERIRIAFGRACTSVR
jgi:hypothetical protein